MLRCRWTPKNTKCQICKTNLHQVRHLHWQTCEDTCCARIPWSASCVLPHELPSPGRRLEATGAKVSSCTQRLMHGPPSWCLQEAKYCQGCAYSKGICAMCGKQILDVKNYKQSTT